LPWQYFNADYQEYIGHALLSNVKQLAYQVTGNRMLSCGNSDSINWRETQLNDKIHKIEQYLKRGNVREAIQESNKTIVFSKESLSFFRQYQRTRFLIYLSIMWFSWIITLFLKIVGTRRRYLRTSLLLLTNIGFASLLIITLTCHIGEKILH